jgi:hypothetical protein
MHITPVRERREPTKPADRVEIKTIINQSWQQYALTNDLVAFGTDHDQPDLMPPTQATSRADGVHGNICKPPPSLPLQPTVQKSLSKYMHIMIMYMQVLSRCRQWKVTSHELDNRVEGAHPPRRQPSLLVRSGGNSAREAVEPHRRLPRTPN